MAGETEDLKEFIREITLRFERAAQTQHDALHALIAEMHEDFAVQRATIAREMRESREEIRDHREESRAHRQALLAILDRLPPGPSTA